MRQIPLAHLDNEKGFVLLLGEFDQRIRAMLTAIQAIVKQTQSTSVEEYKATLTARIFDLYRHYETQSQSKAGKLRLMQLVHKTVRPHAAKGALVLADGPDVNLDPKLTLALHLVFYELATNARKYGALSSSAGCVKIEWRLRDNRGAGRKLAVAWTEHGGPQVHIRAHRGFGIRLIERALEPYGGVRFHFKPSGLTCFMLVDLDRSVATLLDPVNAMRSHPV